jgi:hypothetical protein
MNPVPSDVYGRVMRASLARLRVVTGVILLAAVGALVIGSPGNASACGDRVIADWYDNGRIDGTYGLRCYDDAIASIPHDIRDYVDAEDVISRALQDAARARGINPIRSLERNSQTPKQATAETTAPTVDTSSPSAVPLPLVVLGAMSLVLMAAGGVGYLSRRERGDGHDIDEV